MPDVVVPVLPPTGVTELGLFTEVRLLESLLHPQTTASNDASMKCARNGRGKLTAIVPLITSLADFST